MRATTPKATKHSYRKELARREVSQPMSDLNVELVLMAIQNPSELSEQSRAEVRKLIISNEAVNKAVNTFGNAELV